MSKNFPGIHVKKGFYLIVLQMCVFVQVCAGTLMYSCLGRQETTSGVIPKNATHLC